MSLKIGPYFSPKILEMKIFPSSEWYPIELDSHPGILFTMLKSLLIKPIPMLNILYKIKKIIFIYISSKIFTISISK